MYRVISNSYTFIVLAVVLTMGLSLPAQLGEQGNPATVIVNPEGNGDSSGEGQVQRDSLTPFDRLMNNHWKLAKDTMAALNRTSLSPLQTLVNQYQGHTKEEAIAYCNNMVMSALNGSMIIDRDGCDFTVQCNYNPNRFPALLLSGECEKTDRPCGTFPELKKCIPHDIRVLVLYYKTLQTYGYRIDVSDKSTNPTAITTGHGSSIPTWVEGRDVIVTDCQCEN